MNYTVINKGWSIRRTLVFVIILLHALITINFTVNWSYVRSAFIKNGNSFWTVYLKLSCPDRAVSWEMGIPASISTILADLYMVCATLLGIHINLPDCRFGVAGWFGDGAGSLLFFRYFL